jgi:hypothetical protein
MKRRTTISIVFAFMFFAGNLWAKRVRAPIVEPVVYNNIRYVAPNDDGRREYVQAFEVATNHKLWEVTVFRNIISPFMEEDLQWFYIKNLQVENGELIVTDEKGRQFAVDLEKQTVKQLMKNAASQPSKPHELRSPEKPGVHARQKMEPDDL